MASMRSATDVESLTVFSAAKPRTLPSLFLGDYPNREDLGAVGAAVGPSILYLRG